MTRRASFALSAAVLPVVSTITGRFSSDHPNTSAVPRTRSTVGHRYTHRRSGLTYVTVTEPADGFVTVVREGTTSPRRRVRPTELREVVEPSGLPAGFVDNDHDGLS